MGTIIKKISKAAESAGKAVINVCLGIKQCLVNRCSPSLLANRIDALEDELDSQKANYERLLNDAEEEKKHLGRQITEIENKLNQEKEKSRNKISELDKKLKEKNKKGGEKTNGGN